MNHFIISVFCIFFLSVAAQAQQRELKSGLNYTTLATPKTQKAIPAEETPLEGGEENKDVDPATAAWNKYKELATGEAGEKEDKEAKAPEAPEKPTVEKPQKPTMNGKPQEQPQNAFSTILEEWKSSKKNQREMRSKSFTVPPAPAKQP